MSARKNGVRSLTRGRNPGTIIGRMPGGKGTGATQELRMSDISLLAAGGSTQAGGVGGVAGLSAINDGEVLANISGGSATPLGKALTAVLDYVFGSTRGMILRRGAAVWQALTLGSSGKVLTSDGTDAAWATPTAGSIATESDVTISGQSDKDFFVWDSASSTWKNRSKTLSTSYLDAMVGDSGSGGTKGLVPAPAAGNAASGKFLKADGTWAIPAGTATGTVTHTGGALTSHAPLVGAGSDDIKALAAMTDGQLLIGRTSADPMPAALTAGAGVTITPAAGAITIAATSTGGGGSGFAPLELDLVAHANVTISGASKPILHASGWSPPGTASLTGYYLSCSHTTTSENTWLIFWDTTNSHGYLLDLQGDNNLVWYSVTAAGNTALASATSGGGGRVLTTTPVGVSLIAGIVGINAAADNSFSGRHHWTEVIFPFRSTTYNFLTGTWELYVSPDSNTTVHHLYQVDLKTNPFMG